MITRTFTQNGANVRDVALDKFFDVGASAITAGTIVKFSAGLVVPAVDGDTDGNFYIALTSAAANATGESGVKISMDKDAQFVLDYSGTPVIGASYGISGPATVDATDTDGLLVTVIDKDTTNTKVLCKWFNPVDNSTASGYYALNVRLADVSAASSCYVAVPKAGTITKIYSALGGAITVADANVTCSIGTTAITGGALVIAYDGSAAGDVDVATPTAANVVAAGNVIKVTSDGGSTDTATLDITLLIQETV